MNGSLIQQPLFNSNHNVWKRQGKATWREVKSDRGSSKTQRVSQHNLPRRPANINQSAPAIPLSHPFNDNSIRLIGYCTRVRDIEASISPRFQKSNSRPKLNQSNRPNQNARARHNTTNSNHINSILLTMIWFVWSNLIREFVNIEASISPRFQKSKSRPELNQSIKPAKSKRSRPSQHNKLQQHQ